ncbi:Ig-like domain-containing protein [Lactococcus lactis]|uniref:Ig-like domain-containing protein n=1 Tax=Lactococcus lactis TaxID=1358 RepID=UPI0011AB5128|nr:Ig-like domain-containing protein [Lactococcus lactis]
MSIILITGYLKIETVIADTTSKASFMYTLQSPAPLFNTVKATDTIVSGTGVAGANVSVTFPNGSIQTITVESDGTWSIPLPTNLILTVGDQLSATHIVGTGASAESLSTISTITVIPNNSGIAQSPTFDTISPNATTIKGTVPSYVSGSSVIVTFPNGTTSQTSVDTNDKFSLSIRSEISLNSKDIISATQIEPDKTISQAVTTSVLSNTNWSLPFTGSDDYKPLLLIIIGLLLTIILLKFSDSKKQK